VAFGVVDFGVTSQTLDLMLLGVEITLLAPTLVLLLLGRREERGRRVLLGHLAETIKAVSMQEYYNAVISGIQGAQVNVMGFVTGASPRSGETKQFIRDVSEQISSAVKRNVVVHYLLPQSADRLEVGYIFEQAGAQVKFHSALIVSDLRYLIVDGSRTVLGIPEESGIDEPTRLGYAIPSRGLGNVLSSDFERIWERASDYSSYLLKVVSDLKGSNAATSNAVIASHIHVPEAEIMRVLNVAQSNP
jgi:hypothetical protein